MYVSQNKEKGTVIPSSSIIQAFLTLSPSSDNIKVYPANWKKQSKSKGKGQTVRCIKRIRDNTNESDSKQQPIEAFEVTNVDSVDKVYHILTRHMKLDNINSKACECLTCYFQGDERLENGTPSQAIALYNRALSTARTIKTESKDLSSTSQQSSLLPQGSILMKRSKAYLQRANNHRKLLRLLVQDLADAIPDAHTLHILYQTCHDNPSLTSTIFARLSTDSRMYQNKFRSIRYRHDMYEFALLHAARDSLQATQLVPSNPSAWILAGECLAKLRKLEESTTYYQKALELDGGLLMEGELREKMERNGGRMEFMEVARDGGLEGDILRLALDVAD